MDICRKFEVAADLGCGRGYLGRHIYSDMIGTLYQMDIAEKMLVKLFAKLQFYFTDVNPCVILR
jgi:predicted TPR repeat methyltransferase